MDDRTFEKLINLTSKYNQARYYLRLFKDCDEPYLSEDELKEQSSKMERFKKEFLEVVNFLGSNQ